VGGVALAGEDAGFGEASEVLAAEGVFGQTAPGLRVEPATEGSSKSICEASLRSDAEVALVRNWRRLG
jgi:hypothetical protein